MNTGYLEKTDANGKTLLIGRFTTLQTDLPIKVVPTTKFGNKPDAPNYIVIAKSTSGHETEIGRAWTKKPKNPSSKVDEFISMVIDDVSFDKPILITAFYDELSGLYNLVWNRPKQSKKG